MSFTRPSLLFLSMRWMTSSSSFLPSRLRMVLPASGPGADKDIDKRGGFWYSTKVPCANDTRWCGAMAAQLICNQWVAGSTPVTSSKKSYDIPLKSGVCRGAFAFMSPTASPPFRKIMPPGGARVLKPAHHDAAVVFGGIIKSKRPRKKSRGRFCIIGRLSFVQPLSLLRRQGRVAAPSVCCAAACILLAAAPTATPCFRRWRRSSPLPPEGEPLAGWATSY